MSAHDDYPIHTVLRGSPDAYEAMCDEIDLLRGKLKGDKLVFLAINELVKELTHHADAMRDLLDQFGSELDPEAAEHCASAITAYDNFIKEA